MISKSKSFSNKHSDNITIYTPKKIDNSLIGQKFLGTSTVQDYTPESDDGMRRAINHVYKTDVYGYMECVGEQDNFYIYDFYYNYDGDRINTLENIDSIIYYLIMEYNIRDGILMDSDGNKEEIPNDNYYIPIHAELTLNRGKYREYSREYTYRLKKIYKMPKDIVDPKNIKETILNSLKPKNLKELVKLQCNYIKTSYLDLIILLKDIPKDITIEDYLRSCFDINEDLFEDMGVSLKTGKYSMEELVNTLRDNKLDYVENIPKGILVEILEKYPDMVEVFDKEFLPKDLVEKYAKGNVNWSDIPIEDLNKNDLLPLLEEMKNSKDFDYYKYYDYIIKSLNLLDKVTKEKCLSVLDNLECFTNKNKKYIYTKIGETDRLIKLLNKSKNLMIGDLTDLPMKDCPTELLIHAISKDYSYYKYEQDGNTFYSIVTELLDRLTPKEVDDCISDTLVVSIITSKKPIKIETNHVKWVINSIHGRNSMEILDIFTEENIKQNANKILEGLLDKIKLDSNDALWDLLTKYSDIENLLVNLSKDKKSYIKDYFLENINKYNSILKGLGSAIRRIVDSLDFTEKDYVVFYLQAISCREDVYMKDVIPKDLLDKINNTLVLPCPEYEWMWERNTIEIYVGDKVSSREELKALLKTNSKTFEKVLTCANGEKDGTRIPIDNISKWLFGVPGHTGYLFYYKKYNRVKLPYNTPNCIINLIKEMIDNG